MNFAQLFVMLAILFFAWLLWISGGVFYFFFKWPAFLRFSKIGGIISCISILTLIAGLLWKLCLL